MNFRRPGRATLVGALIWAATLFAAIPAPAGASPVVPQGFVGMVADGPLYPVTAPGVDLGGQFDTMVASGVESVRGVFDWSYAQPYANWSQVPAADMDQFTNVGGIPTRFGESDQLVAAAASHGMTVLPTVIYAPPWDATPHGPNTFPIPRSDKPYANFLTALIHRYGPGGSFWRTQSRVVPIRMWQVWNEPNITTFWPPRPYQPTYVKLLRAAHDAIKSADPGAKVVLAGLPNFSWVQMTKLYKAGARNLFDVAAVHPYTKYPRGVITIIQKVRQAMDAAGDTHKPIVADEISWPSSLGKTDHNVGYDFATTEAGQARNLATVLPLLGEDRKSLGLLGFYYYTWAADEQPDTLAFDFSGLFRFNPTAETFTAKPALSAFSHAALALEHCARKGTIATTCAQH